MGTGAIPLRSHDLLSSRLYGRLRSFTESCLAARGLYHRWGISPRPEDPDSIDHSIDPPDGVVKRWKKNLGGVLAGMAGRWDNETQRNGGGTGVGVNFYEPEGDKRQRFAGVVARQRGTGGVWVRRGGGGPRRIFIARHH